MKAKASFLVAAGHFCAAQKQKRPVIAQLAVFVGVFGRDGVIRTLDPLHPMQVRYRAALRPDDAFG